MPVRYTPLPSSEVAALRDGGLDAYGQPPERKIAAGTGNPCRHCLGFVQDGAPMLVLAHRPFPRLQPYAETGPIFLCGEACAPFSGDVPAIFSDTPDYLLKGYSADDRIIYGTGRVVPTAQIESYAATLLEDPKVAYVHVRSARNNCYQLRIDRAGS